MNDEDNLKDPATGVKRLAIAITIHPDLLEAIDYMANQQNRSRSNMIEQLIQHGLVSEASDRRKAK
jgi:metal-responsive CopG/Arc/MetJ family transcriptional regulator